MPKSKRTKLSREEENEIIRSMENFQKEKLSLEKTKSVTQIEVQFKCLSTGQKNLVRAIKEKEIVFCVGMAGTGKTYLSCAMALDLLKKNPGKYEKIVLIKSVTVLPDEEIGFLKGTMEEKMEPFMYSFMTNFEKLIGKQTLGKLRSEGIIEIRPIAYLRGSNIDNTITIIDEAQNISKRNMKTILTRIGKDAKMVFLGDSDQIDMKKPQESSLNFMFENFSDFEDFGFVQLTEEDEARNPIIPRISKRFKEIEDIETKNSPTKNTKRNES
jgi:phosphate starvation-inducible PhoH-like protein